MYYTVHQLAKLAGVSVRTLHYYDEIGLLTPTRIEKNGYRQYGESELLRLQQILFFRELEFPLEQIARVMSAPNFDIRQALHDQRALIELKKKRLTGLLKTIDKTIQKLNDEITMADDELYGSFTKQEMDQYAEEAKQRWGNTEAYKQSQERTKHWTDDDRRRIAKDGIEFMKKVAESMPKGSTSPEAQELIAQHYNSLRTFYEPNCEMYRGLGSMYVDDARFTKYFEDIAPGLAVFMRDAMHAYCDAQEAK